MIFGTVFAKKRTRLRFLNHQPVFIIYYITANRRVRGKDLSDLPTS